MSACALRAVGLTAEHLRNPLALGTPMPRLSWVLEPADPDVRQVRQTAYQVRASRSAAGLQAEAPDLWDSGKVSGGQTRLLPYRGRSVGAFGVCHWQVRVWDSADVASAWSEPAWWGVGPMTWCDWSIPGAGGRDATPWIGAGVPADWSDAQGYPATMLRRAFALPAGPVRAVLYASARGLYELSINGRRVGDQELAPEWTDYHRRVQYQAYDVTALLQAGDNALGALLADGWACGRIGLSQQVPGGGLRGFYFRRPQLLALLRVQMPDGSLFHLASDVGWRCTTRGPIRAADLLIGQDVDQRLAIEGWNRPGFDDAAWSAVAVEPRDETALVVQPNEPIRVTQELAAAGLSEPRPGVWVYDLGQNFAGRCRLTMRSLPRGTEVRLRHAEVLDEQGMVYRDNLRLRPQSRTGAPQEDRYVAGGAAEERFEPQFTYHGFRYVEVTGLPYRPKLEDLVGRALHSTPRPTLRLACSEPMVNRLVEAITWTLRSNLHSVPTDCPQRDERLGWMGDMQVFAQSACYLMDMAAFFGKWFADIRDAQGADGRFPDVAPHPFNVMARWHSNPGWGDAGVLVPWRAWVNFADRRLLEEHYAAACRWVDHLATLNPEGLWLRGRGVHLEYGDWLNGDTLVGLPDWPRSGGEVPRDLYATAFLAHSTRTLARIAGVLGRREDQQRYAAMDQHVRDAFVRSFVHEDGRLEGDTQAGYALALHFDLLPIALRAAAGRHMRAAVERYGGRLSTGIQSTVRIMNELTRWGSVDLAYDVLLDRRMPSWLYMLDHGGTTVWERWDGFVAGRQPSVFQAPGMNSFNHYAIGAVAEWIVNTVGGLSPDEEEPGYRRFRLQPRPDPRGRITWAELEYDSPQGRIACAWRRRGEGLEIDVTVPPGARATLVVPLPAGATLRESGQVVGQGDAPPGVRWQERGHDTGAVELESGRYRFVVTP